MVCADTSDKGLREASKLLQRQGSIVNISASFHSPVPKYGVYAASKVAVEKLTEFAAKELGHKGINVCKRIDYHDSMIF